MSALARLCVLTGVLFAFVAQQAQASTLLPLAALARAYGFTYSVESTELAAHLARPGLSLVLRVGNPRYAVNDDVRYLNRPPVVRNNQIYIDAGFEHTIAGLADIHRWTIPPIIPPPPNVTTTPSAPFTINARDIPRRDAISVNGSAPPGIPVRLVLSARLSRDVPDITVWSTTVMPGTDGTYVAVLPTESVTMHDTIFTVTATSAPSFKPVTASLNITPPNPDLTTSPNDVLPKTE